MTTSPVVSHNPYWQIPKEQRSTIANMLKSNSPDLELFKQQFASAMKYLGPKPPEEPASKEVQQLINELNSKAQNILEEPFVKPWKNELPLITNLTDLCSYAAHVSVIGGYVTGGMAIHYLRLQKILALASVCAACAFFVLRSNILNIRDAFTSHKKLLDKLNLKNVEQFSSDVDKVYEELKKTNYLVRRYLDAHEKKMDKANRGLVLLSEQLSAISSIKFLVGEGCKSLKKQFSLFNLIFPSLQPQVEVDDANLEKIKMFFLKFEKLCRGGMQGMFAVAMIALAWTYYAYVQKAHLKTVAGMVHFIGAIALSHQLIKLQRTSRKINVQPEGKVKEAVQKALSESFLLRPRKSTDTQNVRKPVVIPIDAILKLIPAWKSADLSRGTSKAEC